MFGLKYVFGFLVGILCIDAFGLEVSYSDRYFNPILSDSEKWTVLPANANPVVLNVGIIQKITASSRKLELRFRNNESISKNFRIELPSGLGGAPSTISLNATEIKVIPLSFTASQTGKLFGELKVFPESGSTPLFRVVIQHEVTE